MDTRLVIELKRDANANVVLNNLFKLTQLQSSFPVNMVALVDGVPRTLNLVQVLHAYIEHQIEVITRRSEYRAAKARQREHIVEGLVKALNVIDEVIALIRASEDRAAAREGLMAAPFEFTEVQAEHILDMTLGRLTRLARIDLDTELTDLRGTIAELEAILADESAQAGGREGRAARRSRRVRFTAPGRAHPRHWATCPRRTSSTTRTSSS